MEAVLAIKGENNNKGGLTMDETKVIRFSDLAVGEKLKLTDGGVEKFIDLECAFEGVKLIPCPEVPVEPEIEEKETYYQIGYISDLEFKNMEDAEKVVKLLKTCEMICTSYLGNYNYVSRIKQFDRQINVHTAYSKEDIEANRKAIEEYKRKKGSYDELKKEYDKELELKTSIEDKIWDEINHLRGIKQIQDDITVTYQKYYVMAEENPVIAMQFLRNAYSDELDKIKGTIGGEKYDEFLASLGED